MSELDEGDAMEEDKASESEASSLASSSSSEDEGGRSGDEERKQQLLAEVHEARASMAAGNVARTCTLLLKVLYVVPELLPELETELAEAIRAYTAQLVRANKAKQAVWLYDNSTKSLPQSKTLWYDKGQLCYELRQYLGAIHAFQAAANLDAHFFAAIDALENIKNLAVDRWHFRMLNDKTRNNCYRTAIFRAVQDAGAALGRAPAVLDIGTGTGLLALMAAEAGAAHVWACEVNPVLCDMARDVVAKYPPAKGKVTVLNKLSTDVTVGELPSHDLPCRVDVVVTELVDSGLLGEHILTVLRHAHEELLTSSGIMIPHKATVYAVVIESDDIRRRASLLPPAAEALRLSEGAVVADESYTCESLRSLSHRTITRPARVLDVSMLQESPLHGPRSVTELEVMSERGRADAVAMWFELDLLPESQGQRCCFSTEPIREGNGWDQGIYWLPQTPSPTYLAPGQTRVALEAGVVDDQLSFTVTQPGVPPTAEKAPRDAPCLRLGEADVAQLNDIPRLEAYAQAVARAVSRGCTWAVEWSGDFSSLWLAAVRHAGIQHTMVLTGSQESASALSSWVPHGAEIRTSIHVLRFEAESEGSIAQRLVELRGLRAPSLLIHDLVEGSGLIRQGALQEALLARDLLLQAGAALVPMGFTVELQLLEAPGLHRQNTLDPEATEGYPLDALNALSVTKVRELDLGVVHAAVQGRDGCGGSSGVDGRDGTLDDSGEDYCKALSSPTTAMALDLRNVEVRQDELLRAEALIDVETTGRCHAVGFWFGLRLDEATELSTGPPQVCGGRRSSYRQAAVLVGRKQGLEVRKGWEVAVEVVCSLSRGVDVVVKRVKAEDGSVVFAAEA